MLVLILSWLLGRLAEVECQKVLARVASNMHAAEVTLELLVCPSLCVVDVAAVDLVERECILVLVSAPAAVRIHELLRLHE